MKLDLTEAEHELALHVLQNRLRELRQEIHHSTVSKYTDQLKETEVLLKSEFSLPWFHRHQVMKPRTDETAKSKSWESFDSLTLKRLDDGKFQAEIKYLDDQGKMQHHAFKGTRDEIEKAVKAEKDLPNGERDHLLNAIEHPQHALVLPEFRFDRQGDFDFYWQPFPSDF